MLLLLNECTCFYLWGIKQNNYLEYILTTPHMNFETKTVAVEEEEGGCILLIFTMMMMLLLPYLLNNWGIKDGQDGQAKAEMQMTKIQRPPKEIAIARLPSLVIHSQFNPKCTKVLKANDTIKL